MEKNNNKNRLGTGLAALLGNKKNYLKEQQQMQKNKENPNSNPNSMVLRAIKTVPIESVEPNPNNPRKNFSENSINELAISIREKNIIQPVLVRFVGRRESGVRYQIIAGERRWRAAQKAGLKQMPVLELNVSNDESKELALIENMQRSNLDAIEEAHGYKTLLQGENMSIDKMIRMLGKSRSHIVNTIRMLTLPEEVQSMIVSAEISAGHARALINRDDAVEIANKIKEQQLSVRQVEEIVRQQNQKSEKSGKSEKIKIQKSEEDRRQELGIKNIENEIQELFEMKTKIAAGKKGGKITIYYKNQDQFQKFYQKLSEIKK